MFEALVGEQIGQLLANHLDQLGFRDVVVDEASDAVYIPWEEDRKSSFMERVVKSFPKIAETKKRTKEGKLLIMLKMKTNSIIQALKCMSFVLESLHLSVLRQNQEERHVSQHHPFF